MGSLEEEESGEFGLGRAGSLSDELIVASCSDGRLSPSKLWMSALDTPR